MVNDLLLCSTMTPKAGITRWHKDDEDFAIVLLRPDFK